MPRAAEIGRRIRCKQRECARKECEDTNEGRQRPNLPKEELTAMQKLDVLPRVRTPCAMAFAFDSYRRAFVEVRECQYERVNDRTAIQAEESPLTSRPTCTHPGEMS